MSSLNQIVANNIVKLRKIAGISQLELVALSNVTPDVLCNIEHAIGNPELRTLDKIADALEVPISRLFEEYAYPSQLDILCEFLWENSRNKAEEK